jgi:RNase P subunit RPR2
LRIIKHGDVNRLKQIKRFECKSCGCIFEADNSEYKHEFSQREMCGWYSVQCPTCNKYVTVDDNKI